MKFYRTTYPNVPAEDQDGNSYNALAIVSSSVHEESDGTFTVYAWHKPLVGPTWDGRGKVWQTGLNEADATALAQELVTRVA